MFVFYEVLGLVERFSGLELKMLVPFGGFLSLFCSLGLAMLQNGSLWDSWAHSAAWAWKCSKMAF